MSRSVPELHAEIARYQRLIRDISDQAMRVKLRELLAETEAELAVAHARNRTD
jgi:hypothetical protein